MHICLKLAMLYSGNILSTQDCSIMQITVAERLKVTGRDKHFVTWDHFSVILQGELGQLTRRTFLFQSDFLSLFFLFLLSPLGICVSGVESSIITVACVAGVWKGGKRRFWAQGKREGRASVWGKEKGVLKNSLSVLFQTPATQAIITAVEPLALFSSEAFYIFDDC